MHRLQYHCAKERSALTKAGKMNKEMNEYINAFFDSLDQA